MLILKEAWKKLKESDCPYYIADCNTSGDPSCTTGGCAVLKGSIESVRQDQPMTIAIFDNDIDGRKKGFDSLSANFDFKKDREYVKIQKSGTAAAILLPPPGGRKLYAEANNLVMEYYFDDDYLETRVGGKGLVLIDPEYEIKIKHTGQVVRPIEISEPHRRRIKEDSKKPFAETVVPALPKEAFKNFELLFNMIDAIFSDLKKLRK